MDSSRSLHAMASSGMGVWISVQSHSVIRLFHATTFEHLGDVDTKEAVHKMLAGKHVFCFSCSSFSLFCLLWLIFDFTLIYLTSSHLTSLDLTSPHLAFTSSYLTSPRLHLVLPDLTSLHLTSPPLHLIFLHLTSPHLNSPHLNSPHLNSPHLTSLLTFYYDHHPFLCP